MTINDKDALCPECGKSDCSCQSDWANSINETVAKLPLSGTPVSEEATEIHTWFERDRAHVELRSKLTDQTIVEWWDEAVNQAVEDGFLNPKDWHTSAYEYAKGRGMLPLVAPHYIAGSGSHGCLYGQSSCHDTYTEAVRALSDLFELGRIRRARLNRDGNLELSLLRDGAEYCEVITCRCGNPADHQD